MLTSFITFRKPCSFPYRHFLENAKRGRKKKNRNRERRMGGRRRYGISRRKCRGTLRRRRRRKMMLLDSQTPTIFPLSLTVFRSFLYLKIAIQVLSILLPPPPPLPPSKAVNLNFVQLTSPTRRANAQELHTCHIQGTCLQASPLHNQPLQHTFGLLHACLQQNDCTSSNFPVSLWPWEVKVIQTGIKL